jgi:hypothetical protein
MIARGCLSATLGSSARQSRKDSGAVGECGFERTLPCRMASWARLALRASLAALREHNRWIDTFQKWSICRGFPVGFDLQLSRRLGSGGYIRTTYRVLCTISRAQSLLWSQKLYIRTTTLCGLSHG